MSSCPDSDTRSAPIMPQHASTRAAPDDASGLREYTRRVHCAYFVRCADGTLYAGYARDAREREKAHNDGRGAKYTRSRRPVTLIHVERFRTKGKALRREYQLKQLTRAEKEALIKFKLKREKRKVKGKVGRSR